MKLDFGLSDKNYPDLEDQFAGRRLLVVGGGRCVWNDIASLGFRPGADNGGYDVMCINDIVMHYPGRVLHFYSNDHRWIPKWLAARRELIERDFGPVRYVHSCRTGARYNWPWPGHGTSSLNGVYTGLALGYDKIVLAGVPLDDSGHYFDPPWVKTNFTREVALRADDGQMMYWANAKRRHFGGKVVATSGRTAALLGSMEGV